MRDEIAGDGQQLIEHFVKPDFVYIEGRQTDSDGNPILTAKEQRLGWQPFKFDGKIAMIRFICCDCIDRAEETAEVWGTLKRVAKEAEQGQRDRNYYEILCGE